MMKTWMKWLAAVALAAVMTTGCGGKGDSVPADTSAYESAVTKYLEQESMGMKVAGFDSVSEEGDQATALVRLQDAEGLTSVKVKWEFNFSKTDGGWRVDSAAEAK